MRGGGRSEGVRDPAVVQIGRVRGERPQEGAGLRIRGGIRDGQQGRQSDLGVVIGQQAGERRDNHRRRQGQHGIATHPGGGVLQRGDQGLLTGRVGGNLAQLGKHAHRMDGADVQADLINARVAGQFDQRGHFGLILLFDQQTLGVQPPEHRRVFQSFNQKAGAGVLEVRHGRFAGLRDKPVDAAMLFVAEFGLVGVALAVVEANRRRVVLNDEVVPVEHPRVAIRTDLGHDRGVPFVVASNQVPAVAGLEVAAERLQHERGRQVPGRVADEGGAIPVRLRVIAGGVQGMARGRGESVVVIDLTDLLGDRVVGVANRDVRQHARGPTANPLVVTVRHGQKHAGAPVGGGAKQQPLLAEAHAPGVVARPTQELKLGGGHFFGGSLLDLKAIHPLAEPERLPGDFTIEAAVADHAVVPAVEAVTQIARPRVGVARAPTTEERVAFVRLVVASGVTQEQRAGSLMDDHAAEGKGDARRDAEFVGKNAVFVGDAVAVGVLANHDLVTALAGGFQFVRVVDRHAHPKPAAFVPVHRDRLSAKVRFAREEFHLHVGGVLVMLGALGRVERLLHLAQRARGVAAIGRVEGNLGVDKLKRLGRFFRPGHLGLVGVGGGQVLILTARPSDAAFDEVEVTGMGPGSFVVAPRGVKHPAFAMRSHPGPRFLAVLVLAVLKNRAVLIVVLGVHVAFVDALEPGEILGDRVIVLLRGHAEDAETVALELGANEFDVLRRVAETVRRTVQRDEALARGDVVQQRLFLLGGHVVDVGIDDHTVVFGERVGIEGPRVAGVLDVDLAIGHRLDHLPVALGGAMMPLVADEQDFQWLRFVRPDA